MRRAALLLLLSACATPVACAGSSTPPLKGVGSSFSEASR